MPSKTTGLDIADAVLIGERHDTPVAKQYVRNGLRGWFKEGYTRLGIEKPSDQVIPEEAFKRSPKRRIEPVTHPYPGFRVRDVIHLAAQDETFRHGEFGEVLALFGWLTDVIVDALDIGYTVECLDTMEAVHSSNKLRVKALDDSAVGVIGAGAKGFIALVGADHLEGITAGLNANDWSSRFEIVEDDGSESETVEDTETANLKNLLAGLDWKGSSPAAEDVSESSETEAPPPVVAPATAGPAPKKRKWYKPWTWRR